MMRFVLAAGLAAATALVVSPAYAQSSVPGGTTYWVSKSGDVIVLKRSGQRLRIGNPLAPCFTGVKRTPARYVGGGYTQGGGYAVDSVQLDLQAYPTAVNLVYGSRPAADDNWYFQTTRRQAVRAASAFGSGSIKSMFGDCVLR